MRILYVSNFSTMACRTGAEWRSHWLRNALEAVGEVETVELTDRRLERHIAFKYFWTAVVRKLCPQATFPYYANAFRNRIVQGREFDAIVVRYSAIAGALGIWELGVPCFIDIDDLPVQICKTKLQKFICNIWQKWLYRKMEGCWVANRDHVDVVSPFTKCLALPNIANSPCKVVSADDAKPVLITIGSLSHPPNVEGIDFFLNYEWPKIVETCPAAEYWIAGGNCPKAKKEKWVNIKGVSVLGFVDDIDALYAQSRAVVCPVYTGSGTCIKAVEAVMHGRTCIGPEFAFRGWTQEQKSKPFVKIVSRDFADVCISVLQERPIDAQLIHDWAGKEFGVDKFNQSVRDLLMGRTVDE